MKKMLMIQTGSSICSARFGPGCTAGSRTGQAFAVFLLIMMMAVLLPACSTTGQQTAEVDVIDVEEGNYRYDAWRPDKSGEYAAINVLLDEADVLIQRQAYDAAADKIERVLRIRPDYAAAWSRLSWLALQTDSPQRSVFMAKRSNSLAQANPELQSLNWTFIRAASMVLNDDDSYFRANQKIDSLKAF